VSAVTSNGLTLPIYRRDDSSPNKLLQVEPFEPYSSSNLEKKIPGIVVKAFLWRSGVSIVLDGMLQTSHGLSSVNS
jgi:hypothetical protein